MVDELRRRIEAIVRQVLSEALASESQELDLSREYSARQMMLVANWKMNGSMDFARRYATSLQPVADDVEIVLCPPTVLLTVLYQSLDPALHVKLGVQDLYHEPNGAFTGQHSASMLKDAGAVYAIVGHSERRSMFGDTDYEVNLKLKAALQNNLRPILCVGESQEERKAGATYRILRAQLTSALGDLSSPLPDPDHVVIAYEPLWAIGTGQTASAEQAQDAMAFIRDRISELFSWSFAQRMRILYGGSANPDNALELASMDDVDGFLVGGAGLDPNKLMNMAEAVTQAAHMGVASA